MRIEDHRNEHDRVAQKNRDHRLPPVHAGFDKTTRKRVSGDHNAHANPERRDVPGGPGSFRDRGRSQIAIPEWAMRNIRSQLHEITLSGKGFSSHL
jgi:hypothetical protein